MQQACYFIRSKFLQNGFFVFSFLEIAALTNLSLYLVKHATAAARDVITAIN
jgi:hypothetical protein